MKNFDMESCGLFVIIAAALVIAYIIYALSGGMTP